MLDLVQRSSRRRRKKRGDTLEEIHGCSEGGEMNADIMLWTSLNGSRPRDPGSKFSLGADVSEGDWPTSPCP